MHWGIALGVGAALCHSASYVFTRLFVLRHRRGALSLLVHAHVLMGAFSIALLPFLWTPRMPPVSAYALPLAGATGAYLLAQAAFFALLRRTEASRIAPLLGLKILILAVISTAALNQPLSRSQWLAVVLCASAAAMLNYCGGALPRSVLLWTLFVCTGYSLSDLNIAWLVSSLQPLPRWHASPLGVCLSYSLSGIVALGALPFASRFKTRDEWAYALPFAVSWLMAMMFLFACFAYVGPVFGNILQSTRGIFSILIGAWLAHRGFENLERRISPGVAARRVFAAALMCLAIWLFARGA